MNRDQIGSGDDRTAQIFQTLAAFSPLPLSRFALHTNPRRNAQRAAVAEVGGARQAKKLRRVAKGVV